MRGSIIARSYAAYMLGKVGPPAMEAVPAILEAARTAANRLDRTFVEFAYKALKQISPVAAKELGRFLVETEIRRA